MMELCKSFDTSEQAHRKEHELTGNKAQVKEVFYVLDLLFITYFFNLVFLFVFQIGNRVRDAFKVTLLKIERMGYKPLFASTRNLVWDPTSNTLFMVGFREWGYVEPTPWVKWKFALFGLVKIPPTCNLSEWDGGTSGWVF
ncbi:hypothetical protein N7465_008642 [Penicillium sp. CMV-2018d]|nr:hypothetical protein N7465_008642 [Penicillium sp. CMV-2018d]